MSGDESLFPERIRAALAGADAGPFGAHTHYFPSVTSTNDVARKLAAEGAPEGTVVVADWQSAGRGRGGRAWEAPPSAALLVSILFRPTIFSEQSGRMTMVCGLAAAEAVETVTGLSVGCKWPNDLLLGEKKFAGILIETAIQGRDMIWAIAGLGMNVNFRFSGEDPLSQVATTLFAAAGHTYDRALLLAGMLSRVQYWYEHVSSQDLLQAWNHRCRTIGKRIRLETPDGLVEEGAAEAIDESGALWVRLDNGERRLATTVR